MLSYYNDYLFNTGKQIFHSSQTYCIDLRERDNICESVGWTIVATSKHTKAQVSRKYEGRGLGVMAEKFATFVMPVYSILSSWFNFKKNHSVMDLTLTHLTFSHYQQRRIDLTMPIVPFPQERISWSTLCRKIDYETLSILHQHLGGIGKSIPSALGISLDP